MSFTNQKLTIQDNKTLNSDTQQRFVERRMNVATWNVNKELFNKKLKKKEFKKLNSNIAIA